MGRAVAPTPHTVVVDLPAAANLPVAPQTGATAAASDAQAGPGAVVAKAAAGSEAEPAGADASGDSASGQQAQPTTQKGPSAAQKASAPIQKGAAADQKALCDADSAIGSAVAQLAEPDDNAVTDAKPSSAVKVATGASEVFLLYVTGSSPSASSTVMLEENDS